MSDAKLRELERRWRETGTVEDEAAYLRERMRVGDLTQEQLDLVTLWRGQGDEGLEHLVRATKNSGKRALAIAAYAAALEVSPIWSRYVREVPQDDPGRADRALLAAARWIACPSSDSLLAAAEAQLATTAVGVVIDGAGGQQALFALQSAILALSTAAARPHRDTPRNREVGYVRDIAMREAIRGVRTAACAMSDLPPTLKLDRARPTTAGERRIRRAVADAIARDVLLPMKATDSFDADSLESPGHSQGRG